MHRKTGACAESAADERLGKRAAREPPKRCAHERDGRKRERDAAFNERLQVKTICVRMQLRIARKAELPFEVAGSDAKERMLPPQR